MFSEALRHEAKMVLEAARAARVHIITAESCTGGLLSALLTDVPGSSDVVLGGFVTYANTMKSGALGVPAALIDLHGAVSEQVARVMAEGALHRAASPMCDLLPEGNEDSARQGTLTVPSVFRERVTSKAILAIAITGVAGPGGGSAEKPVGTVHLALAQGKGTLHTKHLFTGDRHQVRLLALTEALKMLSNALR